MNEDPRMSIYESERRFYWAVHDLVSLMESNEIDFHFVVSTLRSSLHKPDPLLEEAWSVVSSVDAEVKYYAKK